MEEILKLDPIMKVGGSVDLPGSKSISNRALLLAALSEGTTELNNLLVAEDTEMMIGALETLGVKLEVSNDGTEVKVEGCGGNFPVKKADLFLGNAGTAMRPLSSSLAFSGGEYVLDGVARMRQRPIAHLVEALNSVGGRLSYLGEPGFPPIKIEPATRINSDIVHVRGDVSSQFVSGLLMAAPLIAPEQGLRIRIDGELLPQVLSVGVSALLMQILTLVQQTVIYRVAGGYGGETSQLLLGAALRFWNFSFVPLWGISQGFQPAAGTNYGAKDYDRVKTLTRVFITAATLLSLIFYIPAELFPEKILSMFLTTPGIAASGATNFRIMFSTYVLQGSFMIAVTLFQSLGKAKKATWLVLFRQIILFIPLCVVLPMIGSMGIRGVWLAIALTDAILVVITISMMLSEFRKMPAAAKAKR